MRRLRCDRGQIIPLLAAGLAVLLLGMTAFVLDVGKAMLAKRQLQAQADAAALAGAQALPDPGSAASDASAYVGVNPAGSVQGLQSQVSTRCLTGADAPTGCTPGVNPDAVQVQLRGSVPTSFARVLGIDSFSIGATATAAREGTTKPLDIALVLDRTGSMQQQMDNLKAAANAFLDALDPAYDRVALVVLPPAVPQGCSAEDLSPQHCDYYPLGDGGYVVDGLTTNYAKLKTDVQALQSGGSTAYQQALVAAHAELVQNGRPGVQKLIVFETDGAANTVPDSYYTNLSWLQLGQGGAWIRTGYAPSANLGEIQNPCGAAVQYASTIASDTTIDTIGFHLSGDPTCYQAPHTGPGNAVGYRQSNAQESDYTADSAVRAIASVTGGQYFPQENGDQLAATFAQVASTLSTPRLVADGS